MKIPAATQLPSGSWRSQATVNGRRMSFTKETKQDAVNAALLAMITSDPKEEERRKALEKITLRTAILEYIARRDKVLSPSTIRAYHSILNNRFQAVMDLPLTAKIDWQRIVNEESENVSAKTIQNCFGLVKSVLAEYDISTGNVRLPQVMKNHRPFLEPDQLLTFVKAIEGHKYELPYLLCLHGLRRSEMLALTKDDVTRKVIHVHGAVVQGMDGEFVKKKENKNASSRRDVPVMIPRVATLAKNFETESLCPWHPSTISKPLTTVCMHLGLPDVGLHGLRRSYASLCYHLNVSEAQTMEWGGWSDISTMRKIYIQIAEADRVKKADELKNFFR